MTADILTLDDFRRGGAGPAKTPTPECEYHSHALNLPDPFPKDWGEFWKAGDFWWRWQAITVCYWGKGGHDGLWHR